MNFRESWRLSRFPYFEVTFRSIQLTRGSGLLSAPSSRSNYDPEKRFRSIIRGARTSKVVFAIFCTIGSALPFFEFLINPGPYELVGAIALSLSISLAYLVFYSLQVLPSFSEAEPYSLLSTLPMSEKDFSLVATLSFARTFDYLALSSLAVQVLAVALLTRSSVAAGLMFVASSINLIFAVALALWLSGVFYRNATRGGRSKSAAAGRMLFLITWGFAAMSIGFIFDFISSVLPILGQTISSSLSQPLGILFTVLHPFSLSLAITDLVYPSVLSPTGYFLSFALSLGASAGYVLLSYVAARRTFHSIFRITHGEAAAIVRVSAREFLLKLRAPVFAYVMKDLRVAAKTPSMAFLYAAPLFEVVAIYYFVLQFETLRASTIIVGTLIGCFFTIMICSVLLNAEGSGLEYTLTLPVGSRMVIVAKALVATLSFLPVPFALAAMGIFRSETSRLLVLIPFAEVIAVASACVAEVAFFVKGYEAAGGPKGMSVMAGSDMLRLVESFAISFVILVIPIGGYAITFVFMPSHLLALVSLVVIALAELASVLWIVRRRARI